MRAGVQIQLLTFVSLVLQSFVLPLIMGIENYGAAIYSFTFCLLIAAIFEPFSQHGASFEDAIQGERLVTFSFFVLAIIIATVQSFLYMLGSFELSVLVLSTLSGFLFLISIHVQARAYAAGKISEVASALLISTISFFIVMGGAYYFDLIAVSVYFYSFIVMQGVLAVAVCILCGGGLGFDFNFDLRGRGAAAGIFKIFYESLSWRAFFILFSLMYVWFVGYQYGMQTAGEVKVVLSCLLGARYLYPINAPMFHKLAERDIRKALKALVVMFVFFCFVMECGLILGEWFAHKVPIIERFSFVLDSPWFFWGAPTLLCSIAIGSIYVRLGLPSFSLGAAILGFSVSVSLLFGAVESGLSFFVGNVIFILFFILVLLWRFYAHSR